MRPDVQSDGSVELCSLPEVSALVDFRRSDVEKRERKGLPASLSRFPKRTSRTGASRSISVEGRWKENAYLTTVRVLREDREPVR